jgi:uncharacterized protein YfaS (alpha-2-macroglobulin family)
MFLVVGDVNLTFKAGPQDALTWALDLRTGQPMANADVTILDANGETVASGQTDSDGIWQADVELTNLDRQDLQVYYAMVAAPGDADFSISPSNWNVGITPWDLGYTADYRGEHPYYYTYTDRPRDRAGQTVIIAAWRETLDGLHPCRRAAGLLHHLQSRRRHPGIYFAALGLAHDGELRLPDRPSRATTRPAMRTTACSSTSRWRTTASLR